MPERVEASATFGSGIMTAEIQLFRLEPGLRFEHEGALASTLRAWNESALDLPAGATHYVYAHRGGATLECSQGRFVLEQGMYAAAVGAARVEGPGSGMVVSRNGHLAMFLLGGPIEVEGRLRYIDGCTDSLLLPPTRLGDPCLNHLHIPAGTRQSRHTHPSVRIGMVTRGRGRCVTPGGEQPLEPGVGFSIPPDGLHCFHTDAEALDVVVYHPDSDTGPSDEDHPMLNRTILETRQRT